MNQGTLQHLQKHVCEPVGFVGLVAGSLGLLQMQHELAQGFNMALHEPVGLAASSKAICEPEGFACLGRFSMCHSYRAWAYAAEWAHAAAGRCMGCMGCLTAWAYQPALWPATAGRPTNESWAAWAALQARDQELPTTLCVAHLDIVTPSANISPGGMGSQQGSGTGNSGSASILAGLGTGMGPGAGMGAAGGASILPGWGTGLMSGVGGAGIPAGLAIGSGSGSGMGGGGGAAVAMRERQLAEAEAVKAVVQVGGLFPQSISLSLSVP